MISKDAIYLIGGPEEEGLELRNVVVDAIALEILKAIPEGLRPTIILALRNAYARCHGEVGEEGEGVTFLRMRSGPAFIELTLAESSSNHGDIDQVVLIVEGFATIDDTITISNDGVRVGGIPETIALNINEGDPVTDTVEADILLGRTVKSVITVGSGHQILFNDVKAEWWSETLSHWKQDPWLL